MRLEKFERRINEIYMPSWLPQLNWLRHHLRKTNTWYTSSRFFIHTSCYLNGQRIFNLENCDKKQQDKKMREKLQIKIFHSRIQVNLFTGIQEFRFHK